jgi:integrase
MPVFYNKARKSYYIRVVVGGRRFYCYKPAGPNQVAWTRKKDAQLYEPTFLSTLTDQCDNKDLTCDDLAVLFLEEQKLRLKPNTYYGVERTFQKYIAPFFRKMKVMDVTNAYLDTVNMTLNRRKKNVYQQACCCRSFIRFLKKSKAELDPARVSTPKNHKPDDEYYVIYTPEQFKQLLSAIEDERDRFMVALLFYYGLRCGEMMGLKWEDFSSGKLHIRRSVSRRGADGPGQAITTPKTKNSVRDYPIIEPIKPFLESLPRESEWCFPCGNKNGVGAVTIGHSEVRRRIDKYVEKAGLPHIKVHGFRHSCVSWLLSKGMSYRTVARWVGDTEAVVLSTYSHLLPDEKDQIAEFIGKEFKDE